MSKIIGVTVGTPLSASSVANAIKGKASGEVVALTDVSPLEHEMKVKLSSSVEPEYTLITDYSSSFYFHSGDGAYTITQIEDYPESDGLCIDFEDGNSYMTGMDAYVLDWQPEEGDIVYVINGLPYYISNGVDVSGATLKKYGKNLFDASRLETARWSVDDSGVWSGTASALRAFFPQTNPYMTFDNVDFITISLYGRSDNPNLSQSSMYINALYEDGTKSTLLRNFANTETYYKATSDTNKKIKGIFFDYGSFGDRHYMRDIQIEVGTTATAYTPYVAPTEHTADANGIVSGVIGNGESITLLTDTAGVTIEAEYNVDTKKYIDKKFAELQALILEV